MSVPLSGGGMLESREYFEKALQLDPDDITTNFWFGLTLVRSGYNRAGWNASNTRWRSIQWCRT